MAEISAQRMSPPEAGNDRKESAMMKKFFLTLAIPAMLLICAGCNSAQLTADIPAVQNFSLEKYLGTWYEIARLPHSFERDVAQAKAEYLLMPDGKVKVVNSGLKNGAPTSVEGVAVMKDGTGVGELRVSFFRPFYGDYRIIYLTPDYSVAMVTSATRDYFWLLARTPEVNPALLRECLDRAAKWGFAVELLQYPNGGVFTR